MSELNSLTSSSFYEQPRKRVDKQNLYRNIKMSMQEIQRVANDVDQNMKKIRENVEITATLLNAINIHSKPEQD